MGLETRARSMLESGQYLRGYNGTAEDLFAHAWLLAKDSKLEELNLLPVDLTLRVIAICDEWDKAMPDDEYADIVRSVFSGRLMGGDPKGLPPLRDDLKDFEKAAGISVDVLVKFKRFSNVVIGRYLHGIEEWQANNVGGNYDVDSVEEWWPMPVIGTGTVPEIKQEGE